MTKIERSIRIQESSDEVFRILTDLRLIPRWAVIAQDTYVLPEEKLERVGQRFEWIIRAGGRRMDTHWEVTEYRPPRAVAYHVTAPKEGRLQMKQRVLDAGEGASRVELEVDYEMPGGRFGRLVDVVYGERKNQQAVQRSLHNLKDLVEAIQEYRNVS